jgi:hypothetical protein
MTARRAYAAVVRWTSLPRIVAAEIVGLFLVAAVTLLAKDAGWASDVDIYRNYAAQALSGKVPYRDYSLEYPPLALLPMLLPALLVGTSKLAYLLALVVENIALFAATAAVACRLLERESTSFRARRGGLQHLALAGILGFILLWRFDPFVALLSVLSLSAYAREKMLAAGVWAGLAAAAKLVPVVLVAVFACDLLARRRFSDIVRLGVGGGLALGAFFGPALLLAGGKALGFLAYHAQRGVQIESLPGGLLLLAGALGGPAVRVEFNFGAFHLDSPWAKALLPCLAPLALLLIVAALVRAFVLLREQRGSLRLTFSMVFLVLLVFTLSSKVLSPQYLIWLIPFAPFLRARQFALFAGICVLTLAIYPVAYGHLLRMNVAAVLLLNLRNGLLVALALWIGRGTMRRPVPALSLGQA